MISIKKVSKQFQNNDKTHKVLNEISLDIESSEIFALIGSSGAGKSTLLRCLNLLERPDSGQIWIDDIELTQLSPAELRTQRQQIGMIFQHFNLINNKTVFDNVALPLILSGEKDELTEKVIQMLALVELSDKIDAYPSQLSGGQKQRVAIARALINKPKLLLCDEATSALDPRTTTEVLNLLQRINQQLGVTIVVVSHEMDVIRQVCQRFAILEQGKLEQVSAIQTILKTQPSQHLLLEGLQPKLPPYLKRKLQKRSATHLSPVCQMTFYGDISQQAIISQLSMKYQVNLNILQANIDEIGGQTFGILILQIDGTESQQQSVFNALKQQQLNVEILGYV